jgi:hypothetical protein
MSIIPALLLHQSSNFFVQLPTVSSSNSAFSSNFREFPTSFPTVPNFAVSQHQFTIKLSQAHPILDFNSNHLLENISNFSTPFFDDFGETTIMTQHLSGNIMASYFASVPCVRILPLPLQRS